MSSSSRIPQAPPTRIKAPLTSSLLPPPSGSPRMRTKSTGPASAPRPTARSPIPPLPNGSSPSPSTPRVRTQSTMSPTPGKASPRTPLSTTGRSRTTSTLANKSGTPLRARVTPSSLSKASTSASTTAPSDDASPSPTTKQMSLRDQIALKRAEAKKAAATSNNSSPKDSEFYDKPPDSKSSEVEEDLFGRLSLREVIDKAKNSGSLNVSTRGLPCIPSALFELHLHVTPEPLKSVAEEPPIGEPKVLKKGGDPAWYESLDLEILRASANEIVEIQSEIYLFGSLKILDLKKNRIESLPDSFADLCNLRNLDLSENRLTKLPTNIWALPELTNLNLSHNNLDALPFNAPFTSGITKTSHTSSNLFEPEIVRAKSPCPNLLILNVSFNRLSANAIDPHIPAALTKLDLSENPLDDCKELFRILSLMRRLKDLRFSRAILDDSSFPPTPFSSASFPSLLLFDVEETSVTPGTAEKAFSSLGRELDFNFTTDEYPPPGKLRIIVGKKVVKEAWEIEAERRVKSRALKFGIPEGEAVDSKGQQLSHAFPSMQDKKPAPTKVSRAPEVIKEAWEIGAEQGLLTEGGKRRARAQAAAAAASTKKDPSSSGSHSAKSSAHDMTSRQFYDSVSQTLTLPPSSPAPLARHGRSVSLAITSSSLPKPTDAVDIGLPAPSLPLDVINTQPFAHTLRVLILKNRRQDKSFSIPSLPAMPFLPNLETLSLEGCGLGDSVSVAIPSSTSRTQESLLPLISSLFPSLRSLDLSYNSLTSSAFTTSALSTLMLATQSVAGLRQLQLRGNRLTELDGFVGVADKFKGNRVLQGWKLEELDLRDNEIGRLPAELGLMPLDVFLVEGNKFRVPQRRIWEREGTKGLLNWLRGRIE